MLTYIDLLIYSNRWSLRLFRHGLFWVADIISYLSVVSVNGVVSRYEFYGVLLRTIPLAATVYVVIYYLIPVFSRKHDYGKLILGILAVLIFIGIGLRFFNYYVVNALLDPSQNAHYEIFHLPLIVRNIFSSMSVICLAATIKLVKNKSDLQRRNELLETERKAAELNFLKAQMHPHFLFNTLNTLYSETMQHSPKAEQVVLHLSNLLRFVLEECNKPLVPLDAEIQVIRGYAALEQLRHGERLRVSMETPTPAREVKISPLLFLPFVENSFKHSLTNLRGTVSVDIKISTLQGRVRFEVVNDSARATKVNGHGLGIANVRRQLDLLYQNRYTLQVNETDSTFTVVLSIPSDLV